MFIFDTDHLSLLELRDLPERARITSRASAHPGAAFYVSIVSFQERVAGWNAYISHARTHDQVIRAYEKFRLILSDFSQMQVIRFDRSMAAVFDSMRTDGVRIATLDLRIAATALVRDMTLLSRNLKDFRKVPGLRVEDWTIE